MERWPPEFVSTVRAHAFDLTGWVVASSGECLVLQRQEVATIHRALVAVHERDLRAGARPPGRSWLVGVLVCPGDALETLASWAGELAEEDVRRVRLYFLPGADPVKALSAWYAAGLPDPYTADVDDWPGFHRRFGLDLNQQIYLDHRGS